jgi:hypothetical protein
MTQPAGIDWTGMRVQKRFSGVALAGATVSRGTLLHRNIDPQ